MKRLVTGLFLILGFTALSQSKNYFVSMDGDTTYCEIKTKGPSKIIATINNQKVKYSAKDIKSYHKGETYISAQAHIPSRYGIKGWTFLQQLEKGEMNLYVMYTSRTVTDPTTHRSETTITPTFHVKMKSETDGEFIMLSLGWRKKLSELGVGCGALIEKLEDAKSGDYREDYLVELVKLYNTCPK